MTSPSRKKIAFVLLNMGGGGAERVALASMRDLVRRGHDVDVVMLRKEGELLPLLPPEARIIDLKARQVRDAPLKLWRYFRKERPDAVHVMMWPLTVATILAYRLARLRGVLMVNDQITYTKVPGHSALFQALALTTRLLYPAANHRVLCSNGAAEALSKISGLPLERFEVIYNPIEPPAEIATDPAIERLWGGAAKRLIAVGSLKPQKNHALLLDAFARLPDKSARLMILGEGPLRATLTEQAAALGISERVVMPGFALDPWPYYASANLFVLSSDFEGFANVITEAMWAGLNVVCTDCESGPREILAGGRFGTLVPVGNAGALSAAITEALEAPPRAEEMRARALEISGTGSIARYSELLLG